MLMHVITNFTANAGAEAMLSRLLAQETRDCVVVPLLDVSDRYREASSPSVRFVPLQARSAPRLAAALPRLARLIAAERPDAVLCWMYHAMVAGTLAAAMTGGGTPLYWNVRQSLDDPAALSRSTRTALRAARRLSRFPSGITFNSSRALALHEEFGFRNPNMTVIPNGFDAAPALSPGGRRPTVFGIAARFHPQKDHRTFFEAAAIVARRHPEARFHAAGAGLSADNDAVGTMIAAAGLSADSVTLCGEVTDMAAFYRGIDVLVLSSRTEGFPNVVGEAMNHGVPVVTTDVGDAAAIVGDTGLVVPPCQPQALAAAMERMLFLDADAYRQRGAAARRRILEHYSLSSVSRQYRAFLQGA